MLQIFFVLFSVVITNSHNDALAEKIVETTIKLLSNTRFFENHLVRARVEDWSKLKLSLFRNQTIASLRLLDQPLIYFSNDETVGQNGIYSPSQ